MPDFDLNSHWLMQLTMMNIHSMSRLLFSITLLCTSFIIYAQRPIHVLGDMIVHTRSKESLSTVLREASVQRGIPTRIRLVRALVPESNIWLLHVDHTLINERELLQSVQRMPDVIAAQFNHVMESRGTPNDANFGNQWQWHNTGQTGGMAGADLDLISAWEITSGGLTSTGDTIVVAVVDDGVNLNHPDLAENLWVNHAEVPGNQIDDDNNGYVDDFLGWNTTQGNDDVSIGGSHGTRVSGMIGAKGNNNEGVSGVNWQVKIMTIRPISTEEATVIESYNYALTQRKIYNASNGQEGAFVVAVNSSWGINYGQPSDAPIWCAFYDTMGVHGILNAAATANLSIDIDIEGDLPTACSSEYLVSVTSTNHNDVKVTAGFGLTTIDLAAPGQNVYTTNNNGGYSATSGTSFASPTVAGLIGLLYSVPCGDLGDQAIINPGQTALLVRDALFNGVDQLTNLQNLCVTGGRANAYNSVQLLMAACSACPAPADLNAGNLTETDATITWSDPGSALSFDMRYRMVGAPLWTELPNVSTPFNLGGLTLCTEYELEIRAICDVDSSFYAAHVFTTDGCCDAPADFTIIEVTDTTATFSWSPVPGASYVFSYLEEGALDYVVFPGITDTSLTLVDLPPCTSIQVEIKSECGNESSSISIVEINTSGCTTCANTPVCAANADDSSLEFIQSIAVGTFTNVSGDNGGYADFTALGTDLLTFYKYPYTLTPGFAGSFNYTETWQVWIDFNQDGDFDDVDELVIGPTPSANPITGFIKIPGSALPGSTRMRVKMAFGASPFSCGSFNYGEVEDYCVNIVSAQEPCDYPDETTLLSSTDTSATITWTTIGSSVGYIVEFREVGTPNWVQLQTLTPPLKINGLLPCVDYEVRISTDCDTAQSIFGNSLFFTSKGCGACLDFTFCEAGGTPNSSQWIDQITIAGETNSSGLDNGYAFFEDVPIILNTNYDYDVVIKPGFLFGPNSTYYRVYIDYNQNGTFGPFEQVALLDDDDSDEVTLSFTVPSGAAAGPTRMRIVAQSYFGDNNPCALFGTGEVEDYCVNIVKADPPCIPRPISIASIVEDTVVLSWKEVKPANTYIIQYRLVGNPDWISLTSTTNSIMITPLLLCSDYEARMLSICDNDSTAYGPIFTFKSFGCGACLDFDYCTLEGTFATSEWIETVELNTLNNISGINNGYAFFEDQTTAIDTGKVYTITVTPGFSGFEFDEVINAWIDFNKDGIFDGSELILSGVSNEPLSGNFTVPGVPLGETRMRVSLAFSFSPGPCGEVFNGEVEDYCIVLSPGEIPCLIPSYFDTVSVELNSASVAWDTAATGIGYIVRFRPLGAMSWDIEMPTLTNSYVFPGLEECTEYEVQLVTICQNKLSDVGTLIFKTDCSTGTLTPNLSIRAARIMPNPFSSEPTLEFVAMYTEGMLLQTFDGRGSLVGQEKIQVQTGPNRVVPTLTNNLSPGLYILQLTTDQGYSTAIRMIKQ